ncbi:MAG: DNA polymerase/3'-5' exonuclease PolX [Patescibacteria group bacterium]
MGKNQNPEELAKILFEFSYRHEMLGVPFKPRAYQLASESVGALGGEVVETWRKDGIKGLKSLPGIGQSIAEKIDEYFRTGKIKEYAQMKKSFPVDIWGLSRIEGLGPKHIRDLYAHLKVKDVDDLKKALKEQRIRKIPRWGAKSEDKLARGLGLMESSSERKLLGEILPVAEAMVEKLKRMKGVKHCVVAGSIRRMQETVGDIDLIATSDDPKAVMDAFVKLPQVSSVHEKGATRSSVRLALGLDADLRVVPDKVFGATLQYFTGDKRHNVLLRELALSKGFTLNEYGLFTLKRVKGKHLPSKLVVCKTEEEIYSKLGMDTPPPEIRVGADEIEAALKHRLPALLPYDALRGDMHTHSTWTDGTASIEDMAKTAQAHGLTYQAVTDHTKALAFIHGLDEKALLKQCREIDALNKKLRGFTLLKGTECDILQDGTLDLADSALAELDWVGVSIHSHMRLSRAEQTKRILKALANPQVDCFFHPTCRLIGQREPIELDLDEVLAAAKKFRVALEIDSLPDRSDLRDAHVRAAVRAGIAITIDTDAHHPDHYAFARLGIGVARRGWATKADVLNTRSLPQLKKYLEKKKRK